MFLFFGILRYILFFSILAVLIATFGIVLVIFFPFIVLLMFCL